MAIDLNLQRKVAGSGVSYFAMEAEGRCSREIEEKVVWRKMSAFTRKRKKGACLFITFK